MNTQDENILILVQALSEARDEGYNYAPIISLVGYEAVLDEICELTKLEFDYVGRSRAIEAMEYWVLETKNLSLSTRTLH